MNSLPIKLLRDTLNNLYDPEHLRRSPLAEMLGLAGRNDTPTAMLHTLEDLIASLKPQPGLSSSVQDRHSYELLQFRYIEQFTQKEVAEHLGVSLRQYQREQQIALERLASLLEEKVGVKLQEQLGKQENHSEKDIAWMVNPSLEEKSDFSSILEGVLRLVHPLTERYSIKFKVEIEPGLPAVNVHREALRQILVAIFSVTIHQAVGGLIRLYIRRDRDDVIVSIEGGKNARERVQLSDNDKANLVMAERMIKLIGGALEQKEETVVPKTRLCLPIFKRMNIMVIDDSQDNIQLLQRFLSDTQYQMTGLIDPQLAIGAIENNLPQLIVLDLMMPSIDGWEILSQLRSKPAIQHIPVVVCSILPQEELALSLGADAFLRKPITREVFLALLDRLVLARETGDR